MHELQSQLGPVPIVVITAFGNLQTAVTALENGAFDYLTKPFDLDQATAVIRRALDNECRTVPELCENSAAVLPDELLGTSAAMQDVFKRIALVAPTDASVLITGESGTGKELVARAIHRHSRRREQPFLPVNLASLSANLIESELFGQFRGAFTGADSERRGILELADGGTVLFDEAADIPLSTQVKLLRVLEQHEVTAVGGSQSRPAFFRVLSATNRDLKEECARGRFREDFYFRIAVVEIRLPALRERPEDIPLLAERFLQQFELKTRSSAHLLPETIEQLCRRAWRGNIRELRNAVEHGALMARGGPIEPEHLPPLAASKDQIGPAIEEQVSSAVRRWAEETVRTEPQANVYDRFLSVVEPPLFETVLREHGGNKAAAAEVLGIHRATLRKKLQD
jgi:two-component system nitrogen regulation response regulator GlnG